MDAVKSEIAISMTSHQEVPAPAKKTDIDLGILTQLVGYQMRRAQLRVNSHFDKKLAKENITPTQFGLLLKIKYNLGISQTALARANGIERSTLGEIIDRFEKRNWIERKKHQSDRRAYALHLSAAGEALLERVVPWVQEHENEVFTNWSAEDRFTLLHLLTRLGDEGEA